MTKLNINSVTNINDITSLHNETRTIFNLDNRTKYYGREAFVYLSEYDKRKGKYKSIQYIEHIPNIGTFVGKLIDTDYYVTSICDENRILSIVCGPHLSDYYY